MAIERVNAYFSPYGMANRIPEFKASSATVELAAQALNCEPCQIAKTLSLQINTHNRDSDCFLRYAVL